MEEPTQTLTLRVEPAAATRRLDAFVAAQLPWRSRRSIVELIERGETRVNGRPAKKAHRLASGDVVEVRVPRVQSEEALNAIALPILHEDDDLIVIEKPAGLAVHPAAACPHIHALARLQQLRPQAEPSVIHRLDRGTSGVLVFARRRELVAFYALQFEQRRVEKEYVAVVHGTPPPSGRIEHALLVLDAQPVRCDPAGKASRTDYRVLHSGAHASMVLAKPHTGRKHQIRVHLAAIGHPIVGDRTYGETEDPASHALLHAAALTLDHRSGDRLRFCAAVPPIFDEIYAGLNAASIDTSSSA